MGMAVDEAMDLARRALELGTAEGRLREARREATAARENAARAAARLALARHDYEAARSPHLGSTAEEERRINEAQACLDAWCDTLRDEATDLWGAELAGRS